ncbi:unnamed protein product [Bursaphelenchus xylophilus]|uniref:(pine wood nematode) hypothetical protein n=1 Tax=Bursaphelenchus xylophilus TaxID=6326 RepID=A0A1I7SQ26_BURXY|nr:unnamed protein product [Bursaphelenchus xylophilus]CAG9109527.1 unnamed protein product [Bursaphelenchus xylophilus]
MPEALHFRIVVLGSAKVGKTALIKRFLHNEFLERYRETVEDLHSKEFVVKGIPVVLDILDTNFNFPDMRRVAIGSANAFIIAFAVDEVQSFKEMSDLWQEIAEKRANFREIPSVIVGNKGDLENKKIYEATANAWTSRLNANVRYVETSAKTGSNVKKIFEYLLELSGFPDGYDIPEIPVKQPHSRTNSQKDKLKKIKENPNSIEKEEEDELCEQISSGLTLPFDRIGVLRRNHSVRLNRKVPQEPQVHDDNSILRHKGSLIRRTKHMSLKLHKSDTSKVVQNPPKQNENDLSECRVS